MNDGNEDSAGNKSLAKVIADWEASSQALGASMGALFEALDTVAGLRQA